MHETLNIHNTTFEPALFCAPMASVTHSAFRRLLADFGGYGALFTELLAGRQILRENPNTSTYLKRRPQEGKLIYQMLLTHRDNIPEIMAKVLTLNPDGIDINCGCGGKYVRRAGGGIALFENSDHLKSVLRAVRREHTGLLTLKARLGFDTPDWQQKFIDRLKLIEDCGVDAVTIHPRFAKQHMKRGAQHELFSWVADNTSLPLIANGDILGPATIARQPDNFAHTAGIMIGRAAAAQPWIFAAWNKPDFKVDYLDVWTRFFSYVMDDFQPARALEPLKLFARYYAQNFLFGHAFYTSLRNADSTEHLNEAATQFLSSSPTPVSRLSVQGV